MQKYVETLGIEESHRLNVRLLGLQGGIALGKSILQSLNEQGPNGSHPNDKSRPPWCVCGKCEEMGNPTGNVCCGHREGCISTFERFHLLCTNHSVLTVAIHNRADIMADPISYSPSSYRKAAYRQYILWVYGYLGRGNRRVIPSCVVMCIRRWYPAPDGVYLGFKEY